MQPLLRVQDAGPIQADPTVFLIGRPPMGEFVGFMQNQTLEGAGVDAGALADQWRAARDRLEELSSAEAGIADNVGVEDVPHELSELGEALLSNPITRQTFGVAPTTVKMVEIGSLVVYQKMINLTYAQELLGLLRAGPTDAELFHFALPTDGRYDAVANAAPLSVGPHGPNLWGAVSRSNDFRVLNTMMLDPSQITGLRADGRPTHVFAVAVGYGSNFLSALRVGSRLILRNGSHRAYALHAAGYTKVPMLIQEIPHNEEAELLPPEVEQQKELFLAHPRPPILRDYFDDALHVVVQAPRKAKQVRVQIGYEEGPALGA